MRLALRRKLLLLLLIVSPAVITAAYLYPIMTDPHVIDYHPEPLHTLAADRSAAYLRVLFIGNSFTFAHGGQSLILRKMAESARETDRALKPLIVERVTNPGASLRDLWRWGEPQRRIREGNWDFVVLQDFSRQPLIDRAAMFEYIKRFDGEIKSVGARTVLFMTWSLKSRPQDQPVISEAYDQAGQQIGGVVVPIGRAWQDGMRARPSLELYDPDEKHPSPAGSYLTACLFYSLFYGRSPVGLTGVIQDRGITYIALSEGDALFLQELAGKVMGTPTARVPGVVGAAGP